LVSDARRLQESLSEANVSRWRDAYLAPDEVARSSTDDPGLYGRYEQAELLMRAVIHILEEGFGGRLVGPEYVAAKVGSAISQYGLAVVRRPIER
jgi:hypothetical protein